MSQLRSRVESLEALHAPIGPLLLSWILDDGGRARAVYGGQTFAQEAEEGRQQFFQRVASSLPAGAVVWVDQVDEKL